MSIVDQTNVGGSDETGVVFLSATAEPFDPLTLTPLAWYDPSDATTVTLNGSTVSQLNDKSGNVRHMVQGTAGNQPTYTSAGINGLNCLTFDGAGDNLLCSGANITSAQPLTFVAVVQFAAVGSLSSYLLNSGSTVVGVSVNASAWRLWAPTQTAVGTADTNLHCFISVLNGASSEVFIDGASVGTLNPGTNGFSASNLQLGRSAGGTGFMNGKAGETMVLPGTPSVFDLNAYISAKWGTP